MCVCWYRIVKCIVHTIRHSRETLFVPIETLGGVTHKQHEMMWCILCIVQVCVGVIGETCFQLINNQFQKITGGVCMC